jgi:hypothetical protein
MSLTKGKGIKNLITRRGRIRRDIDSYGLLNTNSIREKLSGS